MFGKTFRTQKELDNFVWEHLDENSKRAILGLPMEEKNIYSNIIENGRRIEDTTDKDKEGEHPNKCNDEGKDNPQASVQSHDVCPQRKRKDDDNLEPFNETQLLRPSDDRQKEGE